MAVINFSALKNGKRIDLGDDKLVFDGGISAADVTVSQDDRGVQLSVGAKSIILKDWVIGNLNSAQVTFGNGSELLVGDTLFNPGGDNNGNSLAPFFPGDEKRDQIRGMGGNDYISGGDGNDLLFGQAGDDALNGDAGKDWLDGGDGNDALFGGEGKDIVKGFDGEDALIGGTGADRLDGAGGSDIYRTGVADSPCGAGMFDKVVEFMSGSDKFDLSLAGTADNFIEKDLDINDFGVAMDKAGMLLLANEGLKDYVFIAGGSKGWLFGEFTGDFTFDLAIELGNGHSLGKLDFSDII